MNIELIDFQEHVNERGALVALEERKNIPFAIKRVYYIYDVPQEKRRGYHAHRDLEQVAVCLKGRCSFLLDDGKTKTTYTLENPATGLYIKGLVWREIFDFSDDCVLLVLANHYYDTKDYIFSYQEFLKAVADDTSAC